MGRGGEQSERERILFTEREREVERGFYSHSKPSFPLQYPSDPFSTAHLDTILINKWYRFGTASCKAGIAKPRNTIIQDL